MLGNAQYFQMKSGSPLISQIIRDHILSSEATEKGWRYYSVTHGSTKWFDVIQNTGKRDFKSPKYNNLLSKTVVRIFNITIAICSESVCLIVI